MQGAAPGSGTSFAELMAVRKEQRIGLGAHREQSSQDGEQTTNGQHPAGSIHRAVDSLASSVDDLRVGCAHAERRKVAH